MQQFTVPQFIDVEDKIIGPITSRQFVILTVGFVIIAILYKTMNFAAFAVLGLMTFAVSGTFAFLKVNGMSFHFFILNFFQTISRPGLRVWDKNFNKNIIYIEEQEVKEVEVFIPKQKFTSSKLNELSLMVDTGGVYKGEKEEGGDIKMINQK